MIVIRHGCIYTIDEDTKELYYAPIQRDNSVNLSDLTPVELYAINNTAELYNIQQQLIQAIK